MEVVVGYSDAGRAAVQCDELPSPIDLTVGDDVVRRHQVRSHPVLSHADETVSAAGTYSHESQVTSHRPQATDHRKEVKPELRPIGPSKCRVTVPLS